MNKPALNRIFQAYPAYIRVIGIINKENKPALNRIFQAYPAYIRVIGLKISNIPAQIGSFRLILPILGSSGYLTIILSKIDFKALPVDFRLIKGQFKVKYSCLFRILGRNPLLSKLIKDISKVRVSKLKVWNKFSSGAVSDRIYNTSTFRGTCE